MDWQPGACPSLWADGPYGPGPYGPMGSEPASENGLPIHSHPSFWGPWAPWGGPIMIGVHGPIGPMG
jgi:hypothetical protein